MRKIIVFTYGVICYLLFLGTFLYAIGFVGNFLVPKSLDSAPEMTLGQALLVNLGLLGLFALQHSIMARPAFKRWWTKFVPPPVERSTYVLFSSLALLLLFWQWQPMGGAIWQIENATGRLLLYSLFTFGWLLVLASTFLINHFDLFGLRQVYLYLRGKDYTSLSFATPGPADGLTCCTRLVLRFLGAPTMTVAPGVCVADRLHLIAIHLEEQDLLRRMGGVCGVREVP
jgi:protein-S-isoprenylcysteine O-methyltransferase Ste14